MEPTDRLLVLVCATLLGAVLLVSALDERENKPVARQIYSTDDGDPIDVVYAHDESGMGCIHFGRSIDGGRTVTVGGLLYGGGPVSCFDPDELVREGTYKLVIPASAELPAVVVGVMPAGATGATVRSVGWKTARAETRGRWFLASLDPVDPSPFDLADIGVTFDP